uniref:CSON008114 protein n=1 Tax=Culicoides sonorensis TaxID=179676 RepID=A0A336KHC2_CULSO
MQKSQHSQSKVNGQPVTRNFVQRPESLNVLEKKLDIPIDANPSLNDQQKTRVPKYPYHEY